MPDDAPQLPGGGADGLQQAIEADVVGDGDLEHIVNDEVAGEDDEQQHRADGDEGGGVHAAGQLGAGVAPVDAGMDIARLRGALGLIAMVFQDLVQVACNISGPIFQHHIHVIGPGHAVRGLPGHHAGLRQDGVRPALRDQNVVGHNGLVILPPAAQGESLGGLMAVHIKGERELGADLRRDPHQLQHMGVRGGLIGALLGQAPLNRVAVHPVGLVGIGVAHLHMAFVEGHLTGHAHKAPQTPLVDEGVVLQFVKLLLCQVLEPAVGEAAHLAEVVLLDAVVDGHGDGEQGGEEHRGQGDGQHRDQVPGAVGSQALTGEISDTLAVGDVHGIHPLSA